MPDTWFDLSLKNSWTRASSIIALIGCAALGCVADGDEPTPYVYADELESGEALASARFAHAATLLEDGRVLVVGGILGAPSQLDLAAFVGPLELFDPASERFEAGAELESPRSWPSATRISDGRVVVLGGTTLNENNLSVPALAIEVWDPATETFSTTAQLPAPGVQFHCAAALPTNEVLVIDNCYPGDCIALSVNPDSGPTALTADPSARYGLDLDCAPLPDGRLLLAGGIETIDGVDAPATFAEIYDPTTESFEQVGPLAPVGPKSKLLPLESGEIFILGDATGTEPIAQLYNPSSNEFQPITADVADRVDHTLTLLEDGRVLIAGGTLADDPDLSLAPGLVLFDPTTNTFESLTPSFEPRWGHTATRLDSGPVVIIGGQDPTAHRSDTFLFR